MSSKDFQKKLHEVFTKYQLNATKPVSGDEEQSASKEPVAELKVNEQLLDEISRIVIGPLYNIHKRSLPVGLDKPIIWNLSEAEANKWKDKLKPKLIDEEKRIVHYYDKVRQDGHKSGVYDNNLESLTKGSSPEVEIIIEDNTWKG